MANPLEYQNNPLQYTPETPPVLRAKKPEGDIIPQDGGIPPAQGSVGIDTAKSGMPFYAQPPDLSTAAGQAAPMPSPAPIPDAQSGLVPMDIQADTGSEYELKKGKINERYNALVPVRDEIKPIPAGLTILMLVADSYTAKPRWLNYMLFDRPQRQKEYDKKFAMDNAKYQKDKDVYNSQQAWDLKILEAQYETKRVKDIAALTLERQKITGTLDGMASKQDIIEWNYNKKLEDIRLKYQLMLTGDLDSLPASESGENARMDIWKKNTTEQRRAGQTYGFRSPEATDQEYAEYYWEKAEADLNQAKRMSSMTGGYLDPRLPYYKEQLKRINSKLLNEYKIDPESLSLPRPPQVTQGELDARVPQDIDKLQRKPASLPPEDDNGELQRELQDLGGSDLLGMLEQALE